MGKPTKPWWSFALDPWYVRLRDWASDSWACRVRRRHHVKLGSHGRCYRCDTELVDRVLRADG